MTNHQRFFQFCVAMALTAIALGLAMCCSSCAGGMGANAVVEEMKAEASSVSIPPLTMGGALRTTSAQDRRAAMADTFYTH